MHPSCSGAWRCLEAACSWECAGIDPGCYSDQDCKEGEHCTASTECLPPPDCPMCSSCSYGCYPTDDRCRFEGTPDYCAMIMAPVLPPACWGTCRTCDGICPAVMCPGGQYMDPCTCKCLPY